VFGPIQIFGTTIQESVYVPVGSVLFLIAWMAAGLLIQRLIFRKLAQLAQKTESRIDDVMISSLGLPLNLLLLACGVMVLVRIGVSPQFVSPQTLYHVLLLITVLSGVLFADRLLQGFTRRFADRFEILRVAGGLVQACARATVIVLGVLVMLGTLGINITPLIASLGVGSLAIALALQPTLENFFSGVQVVTDRLIMEGHLIKLESGEEGYVEKINARTTWLRTFQGNMIIFPNKLLVSSRIQNYYYPTRDMNLVFPMGVHYNSDLEQVERVTIEVATEIQKTVQGADAAHVPVIRYNEFADSYIKFVVVMRVHDFTDQGLVRHEFIKRISRRYAQEGIVIPYPIRAVNLSQENAQLPKLAAS
jgi:small-conductance mechanosensitive channel